MTNPLRSPLLRSLPVAALLALAVSCGPSDSDLDEDSLARIPEADRFGGTVVVALSTDPPTFNGLAALDMESLWIHQALLSMPLVRYDEAKQPRPWLAERWDTVRVAPDTLQLTFHLRRDVRWHDGTPTTAEDVAFTYRRMRDPAVGFPREGFLERWSPRVEVLDSFAVRFRLRPHAEFLDFWAWDVILPAHRLRDAAPGELRNHPFGQDPLGNGPFRFVRRVRGQEIVLEANPDFPAALGGRPYLDRVVFRVVPDATARLTELLTGGVDLTFLAPDQVERVGGAADVRLVEYPQSAWAQIAWNTRRAPFDDARVRRALSLAIDRRVLVDGVLHGLAEPGRWTVTPSHWQYDSTDPGTMPQHAPREAERLLREAGWEDGDGDGVRENAGGRPLRFTLLSFRENAVHAQSATVIQAQLRRVGVDMQIRLLEEGSAFALVEGRLGPDGERVRGHDALLTYWETGRSSDDSWFLHSRNRQYALALTGYADARADAWMDTLSVILDREAARPLWGEYQRLMVREAPVTVLYYPKTMVAVRSRLRGVQMRVSAPFATAPAWWVVPGRR